MSIESAFRRAVAAAGTQKRLADLIGKSQPWVSDGVSGNKSTISVADAFAIERATGGAVLASDFINDGPRRAVAEIEAPVRPAEA